MPNFYHYHNLSCAECLLDLDNHALTSNYFCSHNRFFLQSKGAAMAGKMVNYASLSMGEK